MARIKFNKSFLAEILKNTQVVNKILVYFSKSNY